MPVRSILLSQPFITVLRRLGDLGEDSFSERMGVDLRMGQYDVIEFKNILEQEPSCVGS